MVIYGASAGLVKGDHAATSGTSPPLVVLVTTSDLSIISPRYLPRTIVNTISPPPSTPHDLRKLRRQDTLWYLRRPFL